MVLSLACCPICEILSFERLILCLVAFPYECLRFRIEAVRSSNSPDFLYMVSLAAIGKSFYTCICPITSYTCFETKGCRRKHSIRRAACIWFYNSPTITLHRKNAALFPKILSYPVFRFSFSIEEDKYDLFVKSPSTFP